MAELALFISHRDADVTLTTALVQLFQTALGLSVRQIRCTNLPPYGHTAGANIDEGLRDDIVEADAFVGVLTPLSVTSAYVLFELGARWGARKHLVPVLARGANASMLPGPLRGVKTLRLDQKREVLQLIDDLAIHLGRKVEPPASYDSAIEGLIHEAARAEKPPQSPSNAEPLTEDLDVRVLTIIGHGTSLPSGIANRLDVPVEAIHDCLGRLVSKALIQNIGATDAIYKILPGGRQRLVDLELL